MADIVSKSVTAGDIVKVEGSGAVINLMLPTSWVPQVGSLPTDLPPYWSPVRDVILDATVYQEAMWGAAMNIAVTKVASKSFEVKSDIPLRTRRGQALLLFADGIIINDNGKFRMKSIGPNVGYVQFLSKQLRNYLCADNGSFTEIIRENSRAGSRIIGLRHLSSARCIRTGDPEIPVLYRDKRNRMHELRDYQVMTFVDMPDANETWNGVGLCAASRSYSAIYKLMSIERYVIEKVTGLKPLAIYVVNGIVQQQLDGAIKAAKEQQVMKGLASYMGAVIIGTPSDKAPEVATIPLAELPDRFDRKEELDLALLTYSNNIGLDPQELQPLSGQGLGTGTQSQILDDKASGKGLVSWQQQWTHQLNQKVLDDYTTFVFVERDLRDMKLTADVTNTRATGMKTLIDSAIITPEQGAQIMADLDEIPREFVPEDLTPGDILSDAEKPKSRSDMNKKPEEEIPMEGEEPVEGEEVPEEETPVEGEEPAPEGEEPTGEEPAESDYEETIEPLSEEDIEGEETVGEFSEEEEEPKKKKKSLEVSFKERDPLDVLRDYRAGYKWADMPLAIFDNSVPLVGKAATVKAVRSAAKELGDNATFTAISEVTKLPYDEIFGVVKYLESYDMVKVFDGGTRLKVYDPKDEQVASDVLAVVEKRARKDALKKLLAEKVKKKHFRGAHEQRTHGNRYSVKPPPMPPQLQRGTAGQVAERQKERRAIMENVYPGTRFSLGTHNPLGVAEGKKLGYPGLGAPLAIFDLKAPMIANIDTVSSVVKAAKKWQLFAGGVTYNAIKYETGLPFSDVFGAINYLRQRDPYSLSFSVNRAGDNVNARFQFDKLANFLE